MDLIQLKVNGLLCTFFILAVLFGVIEKTNSSTMSSISENTSSLDGFLNSTGPLFSRPYDSSNSNYYYQAVRVTVSSSDKYSFTSNSSMNTYGCVYETAFYPSNPYTNLLVCDDNSGSSQQFLINSTFELSHVYIFVVTTFSPSVTGKYSIIATGPGSVFMIDISVVSTTMSGSLSSSNPTFTRPNSSNSNYYYESIQIRTLNKNGFFTFQSNSSTSTNLYGCLYLGWFDSSNSSLNKLICDDNSYDGQQFQFSDQLIPSPSDIFTLVITTSFPSTTGSYLVSITGPSLLSMTIITPKPYKFPVGAIVGIAIGCFVFLVVSVLSIRFCVLRHRQ